MVSNPTACLLVIGNEVLSGRTQDLNINFLARGLGAIGMPLREVRIIPDVPDTIVAAVNECRAAFDHVLTTGGIGPTHDDITSECVARAFGVPWEPHPEAWARMEKHYKPGEFNAARQRMATMPRGATLIDNAVSVAPGFTIGNVHVMAGVPRIMQAMWSTLAPTLPGGTPIDSRAVPRHRACRRRGCRGAGRDPGPLPPASTSAATRSTAPPATVSPWSPRAPTLPPSTPASPRSPCWSQASAAPLCRASRPPDGQGQKPGNRRSA